MHVRLVAFVLFALALVTVPALAQMQPPGGALEPDQPVRPQYPVLVQRAAEPPAAAQPEQPRQPPPPFTLTPDEQAEVDRVLGLWEERNRSVKTFDCEFVRWTYDAIFGRPDQPKFVDTGIIKYAAPDRGKFRVEMTKRDGKDVPIEDNRAEHWISDGRSIFEFNHTKKQLIEHKLPPELQGKAIADSPLPFLFGSDAQKLKQRYWIKVVTPEGVKDKIYLRAYPRHQQEKANFDFAEFIIMTEGMSPYALNLIQPNKKDRIAYQFYNIVVNDPLRLFKGDPFRAGLPSGWQKIVEAAPPTAQVRRPANVGQR
jgi:TIGR03009 family protein